MREAVACFFASVKPDVVLVDASPGINGVQTIGRQKECGPVVAVVSTLRERQ